MRRKFIRGFVCLFLICFCVIGWGLLAGAIDQAELTAEKKGFIRLHVLANSDDPKDQKLKLLVRDAVIQYIEPLVGEEKDKNKVRDIILSHRPGLIKVATETLIRHGSYDPVAVEYGMFDFPVKSYGELVVPPGRYEAIRVMIGNAEGANWWCVLFPPLCFVDEAKVVHYSDDTKINDEVAEVENHIVFRYKIVEWIKNL